MLSPQLASFRSRVLERGVELYRDLPWRRSRDPYEVWISEVMLQQTQVSRVDGRWQRWLERFPNVRSLASADAASVLDEWQGMGYNRRVLSLWHAAQQVVSMGGELPSDVEGLVALPGIGPATAAGIRAFALDLPGVYLETNVRTVFLHELFPEAQKVPDRELVPLVDVCCPPDASNPADDPRTWYFALLDYGAWLKKMVPNPSRRSSTHVRQSRFEGSHRQRRAMLVRALLAHGEGAKATELARMLSDEERSHGRADIGEDEVNALLEELSREGFCSCREGRWAI
ncbi:MAG: adenine glycosylase [Atopobiaceae bacterium]|nr:adenine glycosylase [Atopobiaceae bacterium]